MKQQERYEGDAAALFACLRPAVVAIDGPAASGKSTVGYRLAALIDFLYFDTGALYRAVTWAALEWGIPVEEESAVGALASAIRIDILAPQVNERDGRHITVLADGRDVTWFIRTPQVDQNVSAVAAYAAVRSALSHQQRRIGQHYGAGLGDKPGIVMVGRDIGTVVMPNAPLKIYLDASVEERARRRYQEQQARGEHVVYEELLADLVRRDRFDSERAHSPLRPAADAVIIDTSQLSPDEVVLQIVKAAAHRYQSQTES
ncbi:MAG: (d)CMP kinase [Chloroflexi bacterium]|nr:MAG: (d)CMP kinase [Chloroflexota bacterium]